MLEPAARWATSLTSDALSPDIVHHAKRAVVDWFAAVVPGGVMPPASILSEALTDPREGGRAVLLPRGRRVPVRTAALVNGTAAHSAEVDDIFRDGVYHPGAPVIAASLAVAQDFGLGGRDLLRGVVVGYEVSTRVAAAIQPAHYRYWHTTGTVGTLGAAAAVAALLKLDHDAFVHAVATSATMAAGLQQAFRSDAMSKPLHSGHAADAGTVAALAASRGYTGVADILDGEAGFAAAMSDAPDLSQIFDDLGRVYNITLMTFKAHTCCGHTFAAIDGALELRERHAVEPDSVVAVEVATYGTAIRVAGNPAPTTSFEAQFSIQHCIAAALRLGSVRLAAFTDKQIADPDLGALRDRVRLVLDPELDATFPKQRGARVRLRLDDGTELETLRPTRKGDPDLPLSDDDLDEKFVELVEPHLGAETRAVADALWSLDSLDHLEALGVAEEAI
jgi:2-methylcitrate dehydratase PrpD